MMKKGCFQDQILNNYVNSIFQKYDKDKSGRLDQLQMAYFFNDLFMQLGIPHIVTPSQARQAMKTFDKNNDGLIDKKQLFEVFKFMMNTPPPPPIPPIQHPYYPNNSEDNFENKYKNVYAPCSNNSGQSYKSHRNTY